MTFVCAVAVVEKSPRRSSTIILTAQPRSGNIFVLVEINKSKRHQEKADSGKIMSEGREERER